MATCGKCNRTLSANGSCIFCGTIMGAEAVPARRRGSGALALWLRKLAGLAVAAGLLYVVWWIYFTEQGSRWLNGIKQTIGLSSEGRGSPWVKPLKKHPKVVDFIGGLGDKVDIAEDWDDPARPEGDVKIVTIIRMEGSELRQAGFRVNKATGEIEPRDDVARGLLEP